MLVVYLPSTVLGLTQRTKATVLGDQPGRNNEQRPYPTIPEFSGALWAQVGPFEQLRLVGVGGGGSPASGI